MDPKTYIHTRSQRLAANAAQVVAAAHVAEAARLVEVCPGCRQAPCQTPRSCTIRLRAITQHRLREAELAALWPSKHELQIKLT